MKPKNRWLGACLKGAAARGWVALMQAFFVLACLVQAANVAWAQTTVKGQKLGGLVEKTHGVFQAKLTNGFTLFVLPDRRAPTAVHMLWIRAGAMDEEYGTSGAAHVLEHMMFKGSARAAAGEFSQRVAALGGRENAFTAQDYTAYFQQVPQAKLGQVMQLEADRFANSRWSLKDFFKELEVVKEERRMRTEDNPSALLYEQLLAAAYTNHAYGKPIVGWMPDLDHMQPEDVRAYYRDWYHPKNAAIVVAGDVQPQAVLRLAQQTYGKIASRPQSSRLLHREKKLLSRHTAAVRLERLFEPEQKGTRRIEVSAPAEQMQVYLAFKVPQLLRLQDLQGSDRDALALVVLSAVLDGYDGARYDQALVRSQPAKAKSAFSSYGLWGRGPQLFVLGATPVQKDPLALEADLLSPIAQIAREGVQEAELKRVINQWSAGQVYQKDSVFNQARLLGSQWALGLPPDADARLMALLETVKPSDVQRVAQRYFADKTAMTAAVLYPQPRAQSSRPRTALPAGRPH